MIVEISNSIFVVCVYLVDRSCSLVASLINFFLLSIRYIRKHELVFFILVYLYLFLCLTFNQFTFSKFDCYCKYIKISQVNQIYYLIKFKTKEI